ncbi:unnamed protein product [Bursaphelenchus okinawaensis]|uniref:EF-hand domain-containing protein n=1 Tax=Bursaphelenchus okinawaensis TaxID=465554 RepID=A0A811LER0_9BILA|nr:unnamed protein product [Bursaphelenchus okinawaensis]CAG9121851.1 unnamed protein product [Bursaphelenchus okinawaensis]
MGNKPSGPTLDEGELSVVCSDTGFTRNQVLRLHKRFAELDLENKGYLTKNDMLHITKLNVNPLGDRIVDAFFTESQDYAELDKRDYENQAPCEKITFNQFAKVLARFRPTNSKENSEINNRIQKLRFAFSMYDLEKNNYITRSEFRQLLMKMVGGNVSDEQLDSIVDRTIGEADQVQDGQISFEEFCKAMQKTDVEQKMSIRFLS